MNDITKRQDLEQRIEVFYGLVSTEKQIGRVFSEVAGVRPETHYSSMADF